MTRPQRDLDTSTYFHVVNRGADRQDIFSDEHDFALFEALLGEAFERERIGLRAYALMSNHFHLVVDAENGNLSDAMRRLCGRYASAYNARAEREGPVFTGRFRSKAITSDAQLAATVRYVHRNPMAIVPSRSLIAYRWSSLATYVGRRPWPESLRSVAALAPLPTGHEHLQDVLCDRKAELELGAALIRWRTPTCDDVDAAVADITGRTADSLRVGRQGVVDLVRSLAVSVAIELRSGPVEELARHYGVNQSSVRRLARQGRVVAAKDPALGRLRGRVVDRVVRCGNFDRTCPDPEAVEVRT